MSTTASITIHESQFPDAVRRDLLASLRTRRVNHKFHYDSVKQTQKWLALHQAYSPTRNDADCRAIYENGFAAAAQKIQAKQVHVIGLGCGGGQKDTRLLKLLKSRDTDIFYTPCDVSTAMVLVACQAARAVLPEKNCFPFVCDLATADDLPEVFDRRITRHASRITTFFGMIPNFEPEHILPKLALLVRSRDFLLFSANLAPGKDCAAGLEKILSQYDNDLTRDWLMTFLLDLGVERGDGEPHFAIEDGGFDLKRIVAQFCFSRARQIKVGDESFQFCRGESIRLFFSYRYTPERVCKILAGHGLEICGQWIAESEEEGVFLVRRSGALPRHRHGLKYFHRLQHGSNARHLVGAEQIGFAQRGQHGKERLGAADFVAEKFKRVRQGVANREAEFAQPERVQENIHLMPHAHRAVPQIAVIETEARIQKYLLHAAAPGDFNLAREIIAHHRNGVGVQIKVADLADIPALHEANNHGGIVRGHHFEKFGCSRAAGEIQDVRAGFEARARDGG